MIDAKLKQKRDDARVMEQAHKEACAFGISAYWKGYADAIDLMLKGPPALNRIEVNRAFIYAKEARPAGYQAAILKIEEILERELNRK